MSLFEIRENLCATGYDGYRVISDTPFTSKEEAERALTQMCINDFDRIEIAEVIPLMIDREAAGYLIDLLNAHVAGKATCHGEPLGRVRQALDVLRYYSDHGVSREYLVSLPTDQSYPNLARANDPDTIARYRGLFF